MSRPTTYICHYCRKPVPLDPSGHFRRHPRPGFRMSCDGTFTRPLNLALLK